MELRGQGDKLQDLWKRDVGIAVDRFTVCYNNLL